MKAKGGGGLTHNLKVAESCHVTYKRSKTLKSQQFEIMYHISSLTHLPFQINTVTATIIFFSGGDKYPKTKY
jgi:hypothetical protein